MFQKIADIAAAVVVSVSRNDVSEILPQRLHHIPGTTSGL
jgi:hypothetical protein